MLQQTQVTTVVPYYLRFLERFPTLAKLAGASLEEVLSVWSGLGYYRRARNFHAAAREVVERLGGRIPADPAHLRRLPGVGRYTAGAIASIAFGLPEPALDGNTLRVLCRVLARKGDPGTALNHRFLGQVAREMLAAGSPGEVTQALMELGALVCTPSAPRCDRCPVRKDCRALAAGVQSALPETPRSRSSVDLEAVVAVVRRGKSFLMVRREAEKLMEGLWEFPGGFLKGGESARQGLVRIGRERLGRGLRSVGMVASLRQTITYRRVSVGAYRAILSEPLPSGWTRGGKIRWVRPEDLEVLPHGSATKRIMSELLAGAADGMAGPSTRRRGRR